MEALAGSTSAPLDGPSDSSGGPDVIAAGLQHGVFRERYQCLFGIGRGGMGSVEVALDRRPDGSQRVVALKRLLPECARDPRRTEMFMREARLAAMLSHPNVVHAFAFGENSGELFLAMEYVEGESLSSVLAAAREATRPLSPALAATILAEVCDGLHAAHELRGDDGAPLHVVHRDVSPHNVMIGFDGTAKVLDFGVAKFEAASQQTRTGEVKGKMAYMSPEQALGDELDRRSDLFSVGAVLFECLAGRRMWGSGTDLEVMRRLALQNPPALEQAVEGAPAALAALFARLTARDRTMRPENARDVAVELRAFVAAAGEPVPQGAVRAMMDRLFHGEAESRRRLLADAIAQAASGAPSTRRTLEPSREARGASLKPTAYDVTVATKRPRIAGPARPATRATPGLIAVASAIAGAAALAGILALRGPAYSSAPPRTASAPPPPIVAANAAVTVPSPALAALPASTEPQPPAQTAKPSGRDPIPIAVPPSPPLRESARRSPAPAPLHALPPSEPAVPSAAKMPDVDPTPF